MLLDLPDEMIRSVVRALGIYTPGADSAVRNWQRVDDLEALMASCQKLHRLTQPVLQDLRRELELEVQALVGDCGPTVVSKRFARLDPTNIVVLTEALCHGALANCVRFVLQADCMTPTLTGYADGRTVEAVPLEEHFHPIIMGNQSPDYNGANDIGPRGCRHLVAALRRGALRRCVEVDLASSYGDGCTICLSDRGIVDLADALIGGALPALECINIQGHYFGNAGVLALAVAASVGSLRRLRRLYMGSCGAAGENFFNKIGAVAFGAVFYSHGLPSLSEVNMEIIAAEESCDELQSPSSDYFRVLRRRVRERGELGRALIERQVLPGGWYGGSMPVLNGRGCRWCRQQDGRCRCASDLTHDLGECEGGSYPWARKHATLTRMCLCAVVPRSACPRPRATGRVRLACPCRNPASVRQEILARFPEECAACDRAQPRSPVPAGIGGRGGGGGEVA